MWCDTESHQLFHPLNSTLFPDLPLPCHTHSWHNFSPGENKAGAEPTPANPSWESQPRRDDQPTDGLTTSASSHGREQTHSSMLSRSCQGRPRNEAKQEINSHFLNSPDYFLLSLRPKTNTKAGNHNCFRTPFYSDFGLVWLTHPIGAQIPNWTKSSPAMTLLLPSHHHQIQSGQLAGVLGWEGKGRRIGLLFKATEGAACPEFRWKPTLYPPVFTAPQPQASFRAMWPVDSSSFSLLEPRAILVPWCLALKVPISMHSKIQPIHDLDL